MLTAVWDDGYGISVPAEYQTTKGSISKILAGFQRTKNEKGIEILTARGWDYEGLCATFEKAAAMCREEHVPVLVHVTEMTQPQGHSTSGSHERYKSKEPVYQMEAFLRKTKNPFYGGEVDYGDRAEHSWNGDHENPNYISRLRYNTMYLPRILKRIQQSAPKGADTRSWRY